MKNKATSLLICIISIITVGCNQNKKLAEQTTKDFFEAIKNSNDDKILELYPEFINIDTYYKSDSIIIKEIESNNEDVKVKVENKFKNGFGKSFTQSIELYLKPDSLNSKVLKIYDSKGIRNYFDDDDYQFALNTGCIDKKADITDQEIAVKLKIAKEMIIAYSVDVLIELKKDVKVTKWSWESGYRDSASGKGIVINNSGFDLPNLKYIVTYYDYNGNQVTSDDGYVTYDTFYAGTSKSFTFYTSYVGNAKSANISLTFDDEMIIKYVSKKKYEGNEYDLYLKSIIKSEKVL